MTLTDWLHDPGAAEAPLELLQKQVIFAGQDEGAGEKVAFRRLRPAQVPLQVFPVSLKVFHHEVLATQLRWKRQKKKKGVRLNPV